MDWLCIFLHDVGFNSIFQFKVIHIKAAPAVFLAQQFHFPKKKILEKPFTTMSIFIKIKKYCTDNINMPQSSMQEKSILKQNTST